MAFYAIDIYGVKRHKRWTYGRRRGPGYADLPRKSPPVAGRGGGAGQPRPFRRSRVQVRVKPCPSSSRKRLAWTGAAKPGSSSVIDQPVLETMCAAARGRLPGIRNQTAWHADPAIRSSPVAAPPGLLQDDQWRRGAAILPRFGLALDIWVYQTQLPEAFALAAALPDLPIVLDHLGGPLLAGRDPDLVKAWRDDLRAFSRLPNTYLKLGGLGMRVAGYDFDQDDFPPSSETLAEAWRSPILTAIEFFGPDRCMFESNFPVDKGMVSYTSLWNAFKRIVEPFPASEQASLFHGTAARVYRISI